MSKNIQKPKERQLSGGVFLEFSAIIHSPKSAGCYAFDINTLHLRIKTKKNDVKSVTLVIADPYNWQPSKENPEVFVFSEESFLRIEMMKEYVSAYHDCWFAGVPVFPTRRFKYAFFLDDFNGKRFFWGSRSCVEVEAGSLPSMEHFDYFNLPTILEEDIYKAPDWVRDTVWYMIFPDRFRKGGEDFAAECAGPYRSQQKCGGNIEGIIEKLDYIKSIGFNGIYFTPIFKADSSHKYDTSDYYSIDPDFGTNEGFKRLVDEAHRRGIRVMLDAVFNHCGSSHPFWQDVLKNGASSQYYDYFYIIDPNKPIAPDQNAPAASKHDGSYLNYLTFAYDPTMPKWNTSNPKVREYLLEAAVYWIREYGIDGWRLDVSNEVSHDFWRVFRKTVKNENPEIYILGENWFSSYPWLMGDQMDAVMNYELASLLISYFGGKKTKNTLEFIEGVGGLLVNYPKSLTANMFNMLDTHDTARIITLCGRQAAMLAYAFLFTFPGSPSVYYGGEIGMDGDERNNRGCMPWEEAAHDGEMKEYIKGLIEMRKNNAACNDPDLHWLYWDNESSCMIYKKQRGSNKLYALFNSSANEAEIPLPGEIAGGEFINQLTGKAISLGSRLQMEALSCLLISQDD